MQVDGQWLAAPLCQGLRGYRAVGLDLVGKGIPPWPGASDTFQRVAACNQSAAVTSALPCFKKLRGHPSAWCKH